MANKVDGGPQEILFRVSTVRGTWYLSFPLLGNSHKSESRTERKAPRTSSGTVLYSSYTSIAFEGTPNIRLSFWREGKIEKIARGKGTQGIHTSLRLRNGTVQYYKPLGFFVFSIRAVQYSY